MCIGAQYHKFRDSLVATELYLLRILNFELSVEIPQSWIAWILQSMREKGRYYGDGYDEQDPIRKREASIAKLAMMHANER